MDRKMIAEMATKAILYEVSTTPKPGLVDRINSGAHDDMDFFTFMASSSAISQGFYEIAEVAYEYNGSPNNLLKLLRPIGMAMEKKMFHATDKINTHKGIIFSLGILTASAVQVSKMSTLTIDNTIDYVKEMTEGLSSELTFESNQMTTHGERSFKTYGLKGIRGEVEMGFPTVMKFGLDALKNSYYTLEYKNDLFIQVLFSLMTVCEDSNIIARHDPETLYEVQALAKNFIESGGMAQEHAKDILNTLDQEFIKRNISPGGAADLLAVTIFLGLIENIIK